jgi:hypothetical protein
MVESYISAENKSVDASQEMINFIEAFSILSPFDLDLLSDSYKYLLARYEYLLTIRVLCEVSLHGLLDIDFPSDATSKADFEKNGWPALQEWYRLFKIRNKHQIWNPFCEGNSIDHLCLIIDQLSKEKTGNIVVPPYRPDFERQLSSIYGLSLTASRHLNSKVFESQNENPLSTLVRRELHLCIYAV